MKDDVTQARQELLRVLGELGVTAPILPYPAHNTVEEGRALRGDMPGTFTKNLLVKDKKGRLFLVIAEEMGAVELRNLHTRIGASGRLGFASADTVRQALGVEPGALTPLALVSDRAHAVTVVLDETIAGDPLINFHPLVNTERIALTADQLKRFFAATGHACIVTQLA